MSCGVGSPNGDGGAARREGKEGRDGRGANIVGTTCGGAEGCPTGGFPGNVARGAGEGEFEGFSGGVVDGGAAEEGAGAGGLCVCVCVCRCVYVCMIPVVPYRV